MSNLVLQYANEHLSSQNIRENINALKRIIVDKNIKRNSSVTIKSLDTIELLFLSIALLELDCDVIPALANQFRGKEDYFRKHSNYDISRVDDNLKFEVINENPVMNLIGKNICDCYIDVSGKFKLQKFNTVGLQEEFYRITRIEENTTVYVDNNIPLLEFILTVFCAVEKKAKIIIDSIDRIKELALGKVGENTVYITPYEKDLPQSISEKAYQWTRLLDRLTIQKGGKNSPSDIVIIRNQAFTIKGYEAICNKYMHVDQAIILIEENRIFLYCIPANNQFNIKDYKLFLSEYLHNDIMPQSIYKLSEFPYQSNQEIDRLLLPHIAKQWEDINENYKYNEEDPIVQKLTALIQANNNPGFSYSDLNKSFIDLGINSIAFIELAVLVEDEFEFEFSDDMLDIEMFKNVGALINYIKQNTRK